jgi:hypothetical protein
MSTEWGKYVEGSYHGLLVVLAQNFPGWTEENYDEPQAKYPVFRSRFEPSNF